MEDDGWPAKHVAHSSLKGNKIDLSVCKHICMFISVWPRFVELKCVTPFTHTAGSSAAPP